MKRFYSCNKINLKDAFKYENCPFCKTYGYYSYNNMSAQCSICGFYITLDKDYKIITVQSLAGHKLSPKYFFELNRYQFNIHRGGKSIYKGLFEFQTLSECLNYGWNQLNLLKKL